MRNVGSHFKEFNVAESLPFKERFHPFRTANPAWLFVYPEDFCPLKIFLMDVNPLPLFPWLVQLNQILNAWIPPMLPFLYPLHVIDFVSTDWTFTDQAKGRTLKVCVHPGRHPQHIQGRTLIREPNTALRPFGHPLRFLQSRVLVKLYRQEFYLTILKAFTHLFRNQDFAN